MQERLQGDASLPPCWLPLSAWPVIPCPMQDCDLQHLSNRAEAAEETAVGCAHEGIADNAKVMCGAQLYMAQGCSQAALHRARWLVSPSLGAALASATLCAALAGAAFKAGRFAQEFPTFSEKTAAAGAQEGFCQLCPILLV